MTMHYNYLLLFNLNCREGRNEFTGKYFEQPVYGNFELPVSINITVRKKYSFKFDVKMKRVKLFCLSFPLLLPR
ncbi:hypothetical protein CHUAL_003039 [Chamberlinius hualienensis]